MLGYYETSKPFRLYNSRTSKVEKSMHLKFNDYEPDPKKLELDDAI